jgi:hypothetical protein
MRALPVTVTAALAATLLLTACDSGGDSGNGAGGANGGAKPKDNSACVIDELGVQAGADAAPAAGDTGNVTVTLTNRGAQCTLKGFPAVGLVAGGDSATVPPDKAAKAQELTLAKDGTASFTLTYVRGEAGGEKSLAVKTVEFGLPGTTATHSLAWSYGDVALKGDAGEPDASVSAFQAAGD